MNKLFSPIAPLASFGALTPPFSLATLSAQQAPNNADSLNCAAVPLLTKLLSHTRILPKIEFRMWSAPMVLVSADWCVGACEGSS